MLQCCGNPNKWPMVAISPEEDEELYDLFYEQKDEQDNSKFSMLIKTPIPELRDVLADFLQIGEQYHLAEIPEARKYYPTDLSMTYGTSYANESSIFSDAKYDEPKQSDSIAICETDLLVTEQKSDVTVKTDKTDVINAEERPNNLIGQLVVEEPRIKENVSVFTNTDGKVDDVEVVEVKQVPKREEVVELPEEQPLPLSLPKMAKLAEDTAAAAPNEQQDSEAKTIDLQQPYPEIYLQSESTIVLSTNPAPPEYEAPKEGAIAVSAEECEPKPVAEVEESAPKVEVQTLPECASYPREKIAIAQAAEPQTEAKKVKEEKKQSKYQKKETKKEAKKVELPAEELAAPIPQTVEDKPPQIKQPKEANADEKGGLLLSSVYPRDAAQQPLSIYSYVSPSRIMQDLVGHEMRRVEHELRKSRSPLRAVYLQKPAEAMQIPASDKYELLLPQGEYYNEQPAAIITPVVEQKQQMPTPLTAKERMEKLLSSLERNISDRTEKEVVVEAPELPEPVFSSLAGSMMMSEVAAKEEVVLENVELLATPLEIIGYQMRREIFRIPIFANRILIDDAKSLITLVAKDKRYKLPSPSTADYEFRKEKLQALFKYATLENVPKTPVFRIDTSSNRMYIVEGSTTTSFGFSEIEYDSFRGSSGYIKMRSNGYQFTYRGNEQQVEKLVQCLLDAGAHYTMMESSMSYSGVY